MKKILHIGLLALIILFFGVQKKNLVAMQNEDGLKYTSSETLKISMAELQGMFYKVELNKEISLNLKGTTVEKALRKVAKKTGLKLTYRGDIMSDKRVTLYSEKISVSAALTQILNNTGLEFLFSKDGYLLISTKDESSTLDEVMEVVEGQITDGRSGETLPAVNILVKGTNIGTSSDSEGRYELTVPSLNDTLIFSFIGYQRLEVPINGRTNIDVELAPQTVSGEELVVIGYGEEREANLTGAVESVSSDQLTSKPATNVASLLQGQMPGVTITQNSGEPGREGTSILIRGLGTMNNSEPMVIVDGMESSMDDINPRDIESISVLKDAASASIYGTRAANGVILITTKRGENESPQMTYNTYVGFQKATNLTNPLESADFVRLWNEGRANQGLSPQFTEEEIRKFETGEEPYNYPNTDWYDLILQGSGFTQDHNLRFSGGNASSRYSISLGFNEQEGLMEKANSDRYNLRVNLDSKVYDWVNIGLSAGLSRTNTTSPMAGGNRGDILRFFERAVQLRPTFLSKNENGEFLAPGSGNPVTWLDVEGDEQTSEISKIVGSIFVEADLGNILEGLAFRGKAGTNYEMTDQKTHLAEFTYANGFYEGPNSVNNLHARSTDLEIEGLLRYNARFNRHGIKALLGASKRTEEDNTTSAYREAFPSNKLTALSAGSPVGMSNSGSIVEAKLQSLFGRIKYEYDNKYLFEANLRRDGSSRFAADERFGIFPSFSAAWILTEENFLRDVSWLDFLRIKASWGKLGNHRIGNYLYLPLISLGQNIAFGQNLIGGAAQTVANNPDITWEVTTEKNFGVDFELLQNLFALKVNYYDRLTEDILTNVPVSNTFGLPAPLVNAGSMSNKGIELELAHNNNISNDLQYNISVNGSFNKNEVVKFENESIGNGFIRTEGEAWNSFYGYEWIGYFQTDEEALNSPVHNPNVRAGDLKFKDQNGDGVIDDDDRIITGNSIPEINYGLNFGLNYKGIDFSAFFQGAGRVQRKLKERVEWPFAGNDVGNGDHRHLDRVIVENGQVVEQGHYPRTLIGTANVNRVESSFIVHDASYLRLKNVILGYTLPSSWTNAVSISRARVYFSGQNLLTFTSFPDGFDPETSTADFLTPQGAAGLSYPQVKFYIVGLDINF